MSVQLDSKDNPMEIGKYYKLDFFNNAKYLGPRSTDNSLARFRLLNKKKIGYNYNNSPAPILDKNNKINDTDSEDESDNDFPDSEDESDNDFPDSDDDIDGGTRKKKKTNKNKRRIKIKEERLLKEEKRIKIKKEENQVKEENKHVYV